MIENPPNFVPLLTELRAALARHDKSLAADLLLRRRSWTIPTRQRAAAAARSWTRTAPRTAVERHGRRRHRGAFDGRRTPYWAVFRVRQAGPGRFAEMATDKRDMGTITSATAQRTDSQERAARSARRVSSPGPPSRRGRGRGAQSTGGVAGLGAATANSQRKGSASRSQVGMKLVAGTATAPARRGVRVPVRHLARSCTREGPGGSGPVGSAGS
ncbi:hypothetical protein LV779_37060 [Streptomyces thinghirensis]|nr:hypothetical protein [Streptomyces thinghirensis]